MNFFMSIFGMIESCPDAPRRAQGAPGLA